MLTFLLHYNIERQIRKLLNFWWSGLQNAVVKRINCNTIYLRTSLPDPITAMSKYNWYRLDVYIYQHILTSRIRNNLECSDSSIVLWLWEWRKALTSFVCKCIPLCFESAYLLSHYNKYQLCLKKMCMEG